MGGIQNPAYLLENLQQGDDMRKPKASYRSMTPEKAVEIRRAYFAGEAKQKELAARHGTSQPAVSRILNEICWVRK